MQRNCKEGWREGARDGGREGYKLPLSVGAVNKRASDGSKGASERMERSQRTSGAREPQKICHKKQRDYFVILA